MARIADVMRLDFIEVAPEDTLGEVAERMTAKNVGAVVVKDFGNLIGILTERDLLKAMAARVHSSEARVRQWMTVDPVTAAGRHGCRGGGAGDARARLPPPAGARRRRPGVRRRQPAARRRRCPDRRSASRYRAPVPSRTNATNASAARVCARPEARTSETSRFALIPCRCASATVPAARSDSTAVREMNVIP